MPIPALRGFRFAQVAALPAAAANTGVVLEQGGKLWYSNGTTWFDLAAGTTITVSTTAPSSPAVGDLWVDTN